MQLKHSTYRVTFQNTYVHPVKARTFTIQVVAESFTHAEEAAQDELSRELIRPDRYELFSITNLDADV
jgi:hypothetical protein